MTTSFRLLALPTLLLLLGAGPQPPALAQTPGPPPAAEPATLAELRRALAQPQPDSLRAVLLVRYGLNRQSENLDTAIGYVRRGLRLLQRSGPPRQEAHALEMLGGLYFQANNLGRAQALFEQGLTRFRQLNHPAGMVSCYSDLGNVAATLGNRPQALRYYQQAQQLGPRLPPAEQFRLITVYYNLAGIYGELRQPARAAQLLRRAYAATRRTQHPQMQPPILLELGNLQLVAHRLDSARLLLRQGLAAVQAPYSGPAEASLLHVGLAQVALAAQRPAQALPEARLALRQAQQVGNPETQADALLAIAQAEQVLHQPAAYATLAQYLALHDTLTNQAQAEAVITAQARFQAHEQQTQIRTLQQDRRLAAQTQELTRLRTRQQQAGGAALLLAVLAGAGGLLWRYRRRQAAREMALRQRLAADLHDDVGSLLTQISMQSSLLREAPHSPAQTLARLESLAATSRQAAQQMSDVVWGLGTEGLTLHQLLARMRDHAQEVLPPAGLDVEFRVPPGLPDPVLAPLLRHHLYLIYKESLHNVVKHAHGATLVQVRLDRAAGQVLLRVQDNGRAPAGSPSRLGGNGLRNMYTRAEALGGTLTAGPADGGFEVQLALPG